MKIPLLPLYPGSQDTTRCQGHFVRPVALCLLGFLILTSFLAHAQPTPSIQLGFEDMFTLEVPNGGTDWDGYGSIFRSPTTPAISGNVPLMVGGSSSLDFGTTPGNYYVESGAPIPALRNLSAFTLTGWINTRSSTAGSGGNRIISWINHGGEGVDLVYQSNGSLRLGVDGWPDNSPAFSSPNKVPTNINAPASNWVFFAVTYQSSGQVQFFFGNNTSDAMLDVTRTYTAPGVTGSNIGKLAIGSFNDATRTNGTYDRMFRGLMDDIQIHKSALSLTDIVAVQRGSSDLIPPTAPANLTLISKTSTSAFISWGFSTDNVGVVAYQIFNGGTQIGAALPSDYTTTLQGLTPGTSYELTVKAVDAENNLSAASNTLVVVTDPASTLPLIFVKNPELYTFQSNRGTLTGNFGGGGKSTNVPPGVGAPYSSTSIVESLGQFPGLQGLSAFTLTGWVNARTTSLGEPDRVISWLGEGGEGVDLVVESNGSMRLGVDNLANTSPAVSSPNKILGNSSVPVSNWVFFAVTYQSDGQTKFYFGNATQNASLDVTTSYPGPGVTGSAISYMAIGGFNTTTVNPNRGAAVFNGLIDEIQVFGSALSLQDIVALQYGPPDTTPPTAPGGLSLTGQTETTVSLTWTLSSTDNIAMIGYGLFNGDALLANHYPEGKTPSSYSNMTAQELTPSTTYTLTLKGLDAKGNYSAPSNTVVVTTNGPGGSPLIDLKFESATTSFSNGGTLPSIFYTSSSTPTSTNNIPTGVIGNASLDFGTTPGNFYVESGEPIEGLKNLNAFTLTGWINNKSSIAGSGGNRIISWINHGGDGVDLVYQSNGSLRIGIDGWPDGSPAFSSSNKVPTNAAAPASNWTFFAVTYQSSGQVQFYFGNNTTDASLDVVRTYSGPGVTGANIARLAVGAFNSATRNSATYDRMFRGLIDNIAVYGKVLTPAEIVATQRSAGVSARIAAAPAPAPTIGISETEEADNQLHQNYPNPFVSSTTVDMYVKRTVGVAHIMVYDVTGKTLKNVPVEGRGETSVTIDGDRLNVGIYIYSLVADGKVVDMKRLALTR